MRALGLLILRVVCAAALCLPLTAGATAPKAPTIVSTGLTQQDFTTALLSGARGILVRWQDNATDEDFFVVYARKGTSGAYGRTAQASSDSTNSAMIPLTTTFSPGTVFQFVVSACKGVYSTDRKLVYEDGTTVDPNNTKWLKISEQSAVSGPVTVQWPSTASSFGAPTDLTVDSPTDGSGGVLDGTVHFTFTDNADSEDSHELNIRLATQTMESDWKMVTTFFGLAGNYYWPFNLHDHKIKMGLEPGTTYQFRIRALRASTTAGSTEATGWSNTATFTMPAMEAPTDLQVTTPFENTLSFNWKDKSDHEQGYLLERKLPFQNDSAWTPYQAPPANSNIVVVSPYEVPDVAYDWRVSAAFSASTTSTRTASLANCKLNSAGSSDGSTAVTCDSTASLPIGAVVTGPTSTVTGTTVVGSAVVTAVSSTSGLVAGMFVSGSGIPANTLILTVDSATQFTMTANATAAGTTVSIATSYFASNTQVSFIQDGSTFFITIPAFANTSGTPIAVTATYSDKFIRSVSNVVSATTTFNAPTSLTYTKDDDPTSPFSKVTLSWIDNSNAETGFQIRYRLASAAESDANYTQAGLVSANTSTTSHKVTVTLTSTLPAGEDLVIRVRAYSSTSSSTIFSAPSGQASVTTKDGFTGELYAPITKDTAFTYTVQTTDNANIKNASTTPEIEVTELPSGLTFNKSTRVISGTPLEGGLFLCPMKVTFETNLTAAATLQLRVLYPPAAPIRPKTFSSLTMGVNPVTSTAPPLAVVIPLSDMFADPDTEKAVKFKIQKGSETVKELNVILYPTLTPNAVTNFMNYVLANDYENVVFNRLVSGFVLQGGSYKFLPALSTSTPQFTDVLSRSSPVNEPGISNLRGTLAMAKLPGDPNSATHDFFFSLADNSSNLDHQNGGFTTFGRVASSGMTDVIDPVGALLTTPGDPTTSTDTRYTISVRDPRGGQPRLQAVSNFPVTKTTVPVPGTIQSTEMVVIKSITPIEHLLSYSTPTNTNSGVVRATIVDGALKLESLSAGLSTVSVSATDLDNNTTTQTIDITVDSLFKHPVITKHPLDLTVNEAATAAFNVTATGTNLTFQWRKDGKNLTDTTTTDGTVISGTTTATLTLANTHTSDKGAYTVVVTNAATSVESNQAFLTISKAPLVTTQPVAITRNYLESATFTVEATGATPLTYVWHLKDKLTLAEKQTITTSSPTLTLSSVTPKLAGLWYVVVSNAAGSDTSADAELTVNVSDTDGDGMNDYDEDVAGTDKTKADTDGDGYSDGAERALGTNPKLASSTPAAKAYVAERDSAATLGSVLMKRIPANAELVTSEVWFGATEMTNKQFAAALQFGLKTLNNVEIVPTTNGRHAVRYPKTTGHFICYLVDPATFTPGPSDDPATDISFVKTGDAETETAGIPISSVGTFTVPVALVNAPVRAVSWEAAYFAASALNTFNNFLSKSTASFTFASTNVNGYRIPTQLEWKAAALGGRTTAVAPYPTGASISTTQAWFGQTASTAKARNVGSYAANPFGCFDLAGNLAEWVFEGSDGTHGYTKGGAFDSLLTDSPNALLIATAVDHFRDTRAKSIGIRLVLDGPATPAITTQPASFTLLRTDKPLELTCAATGAPPIGFQWLRNNAAISGQTSSKLSIAAPTLSTAGTYLARVTTNAVNPQTSNAAVVNVVQVPATRSFSIASNKNATFTVPYAVASSSEKLTFSWFLNGTRIFNRGSFRTGTDANSLVLLNCLPADTGTYVCEIRDSHNSTPVTISFSLVVLGLPVADTPVFTETTMVGESFAYQVTASSATSSTAPTKFSATGLPSGLTINSSTGVISGKPLVSGTFFVSIIASNAMGSFTTQTVALTVKSMAQMNQANAIGTFFGLINRSTTLNNRLGGRIDFTVASTATMTGSITMGSTRYPFSGRLNTVYNPNTPVDPSASIVVPRSGKTSLGLSITIPVGTGQVFQGSLFELDSSGNTTGVFTNFSGVRNQWNASTNPASSYAGKHNIALRIPTGLIGDLTTPQGSGYAAITVTNAGATTLAGKLSDGAAISFSSFVGPDGQHSLYQVLYSGKGSVLGSMSESDSGFHQFSGVNGITWYKQTQPVTSTDRSYKLDGISSALTPFGGLYLPATTAKVIMGLDDATALKPQNARLTFEYGGLSPSTGFVQDFTLGRPAVVSFAGATVVNSTTCVINNTAGSFTGTFKLFDSGSGITRTVTYQGLIVPDPDRFGYGFGEGYFTLYGLPGPGGVTIANSPILSGWAGLGAVP